ncbi:protein IQ-DOMAIN 10 [Nicotiana sylvestris]|uniref:Protein IQ-DOMAIN 1-like n=2 Tax=Nicotiana TaxID=4085 RepID=A0A1S4A748_TOBAC|nr:PREDICTED: protein IQ-DOMAIN 1 [Nicotiana sylvestris]XP_016472434.1 PREDICTED: protein IQ-DOMAIN 1-like [Nicotiana tabacum]
MGSGFCLKTIIGRKRNKGRKSKQLKGSNASDEPRGEISSGKDTSAHYSNGNSSKRIARKTKFTESTAAIRIQTAFRAHLARKSLRRVRCAVRFQGVIEGLSVNNQVVGTLKQIHCWSKIQSEIRARRLSMVTQDHNKQKKIQNQQKLDAKLHELEVEWSSGAETMEEIIQKLQQREEAAIKRERAMAYAFSHQWRANSNRYFGQAYYDLGKDSWGWSWMERWIAIRPWETRVQNPVNPKISHSNQVAKITKTTNLGPMKLVVSVKNPSISNGKESTKGRKLSISLPEK